MSSHEQQIKCNHYVLDIFDGMHGFIPDCLLETLIVHITKEIFIANDYYGLFPKEIW